MERQLEPEQSGKRAREQKQIERVAAGGRRADHRGCRWNGGERRTSHPVNVQRPLEP